MSVVIRNIDTVEHIYAGQTIAPSASYTIQASERSKWASTDSLLTDITDGKAQVNDGTADIIGIAAQIAYLLGQDTAVKDTDGAYIQRNKAAKAGWTYHLTAPEFVTSTVNSLYHKDEAGNDLNESSVKFYSSNNTELTTQVDCDSSCVKTVFVFEPTWNYELIGGTIKTENDVTENVRVWVIAVPDIAAPNGSKVMVQGVNLKFVDPNNGIEADGRASKFMQYSATLHTNKLQVTIKHPAGHKAALMVAFELFRA